MRTAAASRATEFLRKVVANRNPWRYGRFAVALVLGAVMAAAMARLQAQQSGQNVNVLPAYPIGPFFPPSPITNGTQQDALKGDNFLQRQGEPVIAPSSLNADVLVAAYNDFRAVDIAADSGLPGGAGSYSWLGYSRSYDRAKTWFGALVPGFPGGTTPADLSSPLHGLGSGSDPVLVTAPGGHFFLGGLFFTPGGISNIAMMHLRHVPNLDGGDAIQPGKITIVDRGSQSESGNFNDKPAALADIPRNTTSPSTCGPVYMAYTIFTGGGGGTPFTSKVGFTRSKQGKCGESWDNPAYVNKNYKQNQGTALAVDPTTGKIFLVWRHVKQAGGDGFPDSILLSTSSDFGGTMSAPTPITGPDFAPFDQITIKTTDTSDPLNNVAFRSNAFPAIAIDKFGNAYVTVQEKFLVPSYSTIYNEPRIVIYSLKNGASQWTKSVIEPSTLAPGSFPGGQQVMPSLTYGAGVLTAMWYDFRRPEWLTPADPNYNAWGRPSLCDPSGHCYITGIDRRVETRLAQSAVNSNGTLAFAPSIRVTKYNGNSYLGQQAVDRPTRLAGQQAVNRPNLPIYVSGTTANTGDYITVMPSALFVPNPPGTNPPFRWASEPGDYEALSSLGVWTDTRDLVFPYDVSTGGPNLFGPIANWGQYAPPGSGQASCINPGSRDQNVYFSEIKAGVIAGSPATSRQLVGTNAAGQTVPFERAFPFYIRNATRQGRGFRVTFQSDGATVVKGAFAQGTANATPAPPQSIDVAVGPLSTVSKTAYAYCPTCSASNAFGRFSIKVQEINPNRGLVSQGLQTVLRFNTDPNAPFVANQNLNIQETHTLDVSTADWANADWANADWANADWANADWANADWANADWANADWANADWANADWANADWANADWANADWANADWANADWANTSPVGDLVKTAVNVGNNASSYTVSVSIDPVTAKMLKDGNYLAGVFITRSYNRPGSFTSSACAIDPIPMEQIISVIPIDLNKPHATIADTSAFAAAPALTTLAAGNGSGAAEVQPQQVFVVVRIFGRRGQSGTPAPPLSTQQQNAIAGGTTVTSTPQAGDTAAGKAFATVTLTNLTQAYTGSQLSPTVTTNPTGLAVVITGAPQTNVGSYSVLATINDPNYQGSASGTFVITRAPVTARAGSGSATYDGSTKTPSACVVTRDDPPNTYTGDLSCANDPSSVGPNAGTTTIVPVVSGTTDNFSITLVNGSYTINKAPSTTTITCPASVVYNGTPQQPCSATVTGAGGLNQSVPVTYSNNVNAGTATASASYAGDANHTGSSASTTFIIDPAPSTTTFGPAPTPAYPGPDFTVSASNNSGGAITFSRVSGPCTFVSATATTATFSPTGAGSCVVQANSAATQNYTASSAQQTVIISSAAILWVGNDTHGPVRQYTKSGTLAGTFGAGSDPGGATGSALDGVGHVYTAVPDFDNNTSVITKYDAGGNAVGTINVGVGIEDMAYGGSDTLWLSTNVGTIYHIDAAGTILLKFDTETGTIIGVATDGSVLYVTDGYGGTNHIRKYSFSGALLQEYQTGVTSPSGLMGIGYDASDGTLWVGSYQVIYHFSTSGALLGSFSTAADANSSYHDGLEVGRIYESLLWAGNDTHGPVQEFTRNGMFMGTWGASGGTGSALDGGGHVYTVVPGCSSSVITKYDASQNAVATITFDTGIDNGNSCSSWIEDMAYGGNNTLWISGFNGMVYHIDATGLILSHFDTGFTFTGIATDGTYLYTTEGFSGVGNIHRWNLDGTNGVVLFDTGVTSGLGGIGYDAGDGTLWVGTGGTIYHYSLTGTALGSFSTGSQYFHDGLEVGGIRTP
jgi:MBG domain